MQVKSGGKSPVTAVSQWTRFLGPPAGMGHTGEMGWSPYTREGLGCTEIAVVDGNVGSL